MEGYKPLQGKLCNDFAYKLNAKGVIEDKRKVFCLHCKQQFSYFGSISSLQYHLRAKHPLSDFARVSTSSSVIGENNKQPTLTNFFQNDKVNARKQLELTNSLAYWIASSGRPLKIVEDKGLERAFQIALSSNSYKMPTRKTVASRIKDIYEMEKGKLQCKLDVAEYICLTGDFWTSLANESFFGVTAHWIDSTWNFQSSVLQVKEVSERHTSNVCADEFKKVADEWKISKKIVAICTDNARNITNGVREAEFHNLLCAAHTLQLSLNKALDVACIGNLLGQCRKIVGHFKHSSANKSELEMEQNELGQNSKALQQDTPTRWNSTYLMISSLLEHRDSITETMRKQKTNIKPLNCAEWEKLSALLIILKPCLEVTELLGGEKYVSASVVFPAIAYLQAQMCITENDSGYIARFKAMIIDDIKERMKLWPCFDKYEVCTALDPRFKSLRCIPTERREMVWNNVVQLGKEMKNNTQFEEKTEINKQKRRKLCFDSVCNDTLTESSQNSCLVQIELNMYKELAELDDDFINPLTWWKLHNTQFPNLAQLAKRMLCLTATSTPVERVFSSAGFIVNKFRSRLDPENVNMLTCLRDWLKEKQTG